MALSPDGIVANLDTYADTSYDASAVGEALAGLESEGLVERLDRPGEYYVVTDRGSDYVETEIDQEVPEFSG